MNWTAVNAESSTSLMDRLREWVTLFELFVSHIARPPAASRKTVAGRIVRIVSSKRTVKSKLRSGPA